LLAKNEVFITDWWLSPELYLKRPVSREKNQDTRIDVVLRTIASRGVNVGFMNILK
jgi:phospholipase D1/2